jgi:hypothetical protein
MSSSGPTKIKGDVTIVAGVDPAIYGPGNLDVENNLTVRGDLTNLSTEQTTIQDNAIALNQGDGAVSGTGHDIGLWGERNPVDVITDTPDLTGTSPGGGTLTTIVLDGAASGVNDQYNGWTIEITAGTSAGDIRTILDYDGGTKTVTVGVDFSIAPDATSEYALYAGTYTLNVYDESADEFALAYTGDPHTNRVFNISKYANLHVFDLQVDGTINGGGGGGGSRIAYRLIENIVSAHNTANFISVAELPWDFSRYSGYSSGVIVAYIVITGASLDIQIYDTVSASVIAGPFTVGSTQVVNIGINDVDLPNVDGALQIQVKKSSGGANPKIRGATFEFNT